MQPPTPSPGHVGRRRCQQEQWQPASRLTHPSLISTRPHLIHKHRPVLVGVLVLPHLGVGLQGGGGACLGFVGPLSVVGLLSVARWLPEATQTLRWEGQHAGDGLEGNRHCCQPCQLSKSNPQSNLTIHLRRGRSLWVAIALQLPRHPPTHPPTPGRGNPRGPQPRVQPPSSSASLPHDTRRPLYDMTNTKTNKLTIHLLSGSPV